MNVGADIPIYQHVPIKIIEVPEPGRKRQRLFDNYDAPCPPAAKKSTMLTDDRAIYNHHASQIYVPVPSSTQDVLLGEQPMPLLKD